MPNLHLVMSFGDQARIKKAIKVEYDTLVENNTWELVEKPKDQHILTDVWAFKRKPDIDGNI